MPFVCRINSSPCCNFFGMTTISHLNIKPFATGIIGFNSMYDFEQRPLSFPFFSYTALARAKDVFGFLSTSPVSFYHSTGLIISFVSKSSSHSTQPGSLPSTGNHLTGIPSLLEIIRPLSSSPNVHVVPLS